MTIGQWRTVLEPLRTDQNPRMDHWSRIDVLIVNRSIPLLSPFRGTSRREYSVEAIAANFSPPLDVEF